MRYGPQVHGGPARRTGLKALCPGPGALASGKSQGSPVLVLSAGEAGSGWSPGSHLTDREMGSERKGDSAQVRQSHLLLEETGWASGLGQHTYLPHDRQLHGAPGVGSPVHQAGQEVSEQSPCHCGQEEGEPEVGGREHVPARSPPQLRKSLAHSFTSACSLLSLGHSAPCKWSHSLCPFTRSSPGRGRASPAR